MQQVQKVKFKGFMKVYVEGTDDNKSRREISPDLSEGMVVDSKEIIPNQHFTQPSTWYRGEIGENNGRARYW